jgi:hypothetical protein
LINFVIAGLGVSALADTPAFHFSAGKAKIRGIPVQRNLPLQIVD